MKKWLRWLLPAVFAGLAAAMYILLPRFPSFTERVISRGLFRVVAFPLEWLTSLFPFSLTEAAVVLGIPAVLVLLILWVVRLIRHGDQRRHLRRAATLLTWGTSLALLVFMINCGAGYSRRSLTQLMELPTRSYTVEELTAVTIHLAEEASRTRQQVKEDENGCMMLSSSLSDTLLAADDTYHHLQEDYPFLTTATWRVKPVALSHAWSYTGFVGVYCPWLGEASVNVDTPPCDLGHTAAHELAHTMGFAKEDECNFLAFLACVGDDDPDFVYSGYLATYIYCANALHAADTAAWKQAYSHLSDGVKRDLQQRRSYWKSFEGQVMDTSQQANDTFIKVNGVESGALSYNEMVALVLAYYDKTGLDFSAYIE